MAKRLFEKRVGGGGAQISTNFLLIFLPKKFFLVGLLGRVAIGESGPLLNPYFFANNSLKGTRNPQTGNVLFNQKVREHCETQLLEEIS